MRQSEFLLVGEDERRLIIRAGSWLSGLRDQEFHISVYLRDESDRKDRTWLSRHAGLKLMIWN